MVATILLIYFSVKNKDFDKFVKFDEMAVLGR